MVDLQNSCVYVTCYSDPSVQYPAAYGLLGLCNRSCLAYSIEELLCWFDLFAVMNSKHLLWAQVCKTWESAFSPCVLFLIPFSGLRWPLLFGLLRLYYVTQPKPYSHNGWFTVTHERLLKLWWMIRSPDLLVRVTHPNKKNSFHYELCVTQSVRWRKEGNKEIVMSPKIETVASLWSKRAQVLGISSGRKWERRPDISVLRKATLLWA